MMGCILFAGRCRVIEAFEHCHNAAWQRQVAGAIFMIPVELDTAELFAFPVLNNGMIFL